MASCNPAALSEHPLRFREHYYETCDPIEAVREPRYFANAARHLAAGDTIAVRAGIGAALAYEAFVVERVGGGEVVLRALTAPAAPAVPPAPRPAEAPRFDAPRHGRGRHRGGR